MRFKFFLIYFIRFYFKIILYYLSHNVKATNQGNSHYLAKYRAFKSDREEKFFKIKVDNKALCLLCPVVINSVKKSLLLGDTTKFIL